VAEKYRDNFLLLSFSTRNVHNAQKYIHMQIWIERG